MKSKIIAILIIFILCSACTGLKPDARLEYPLDLAENYKHAPEYATEYKGQLQSSTELFSPEFSGNKELNRLIQTAYERNINLNTLKARIAKANAILKKTKASLFPDLEFSLGGQKTKVRSQDDTDNSAVYTDSHSWDASLSSNYTIDVFGKDRSDRMAAESDLQASQDDFESSLNELRSEIAGTWIEIIGTRNQRKLLEKQISVNNDLVELLKFRYANGKASALDLSQQVGTLATTKALAPILEQQEGLLVNNLALLSGFSGPDLSNSEQISVETTELPQIMPVPDVGLPSELLKERPDIKAAKKRLISSKWTLKAAKADLWPDFTITAGTAFSDKETELIFKNWTSSLATSISGHIFDGGLKKAEIERSRAAVDEQVSLYAETVAQAVMEVENALVSLKTQKSYIVLLEEELELDKLTLEDAMIQYQNGQSSYINYLTTWTGVETLERKLIGERVTYIKKWIELCKALGWRQLETEG